MKFMLTLPRCPFFRPLSVLFLAPPAVPSPLPLRPPLLLPFLSSSLLFSPLLLSFHPFSPPSLLLPLPPSPFHAPSPSLLTSLPHRTKEQVQEEEMLLAELKKIEMRKKERERKQHDLQKLISAAEQNAER